MFKSLCQVSESTSQKGGLVSEEFELNNEVGCLKISKSEIKVSNKSFGDVAPTLGYVLDRILYKKRLILIGKVKQEPTIPEFPSMLVTHLANFERPLISQQSRKGEFYLTGMNLVTGAGLSADELMEIVKEIRLTVLTAQMNEL